MPDAILAKDNGGGGFRPHPEGQFVAVCVDTIALGERARSFQGAPTKVQAMCAIVFMSTEINQETGEPHDVHSEFAISMNSKASLRLFLEAWRGKAYTDEQAKAGVPVDKLVGHYALISVEHHKSASDRTYAKIKSLMPLPKGFTRPEIDTAGYERAEFWEKRKAAYREELAKFRAQTGPVPDEYAGVSAGGPQDDSDLPF